MPNPSKQHAENLPDSVRLFIAIQLPISIKGQLENFQAHLKAFEKEVAETRLVRWSAMTNLHITLKFLGETPTTQIEKISDELKQIAPDLPSFDLEGSRLGAFPELQHPRVIWAGLKGDTDSLLALRQSVEKAIAPLGYPTENRAFTAHLTLGRVEQHAPSSTLRELGRYLSKLQEAHDGHSITNRWTVTSIALMQSTLRTDGPHYAELGAFKLTGKSHR